MREFKVVSIDMFGTLVDLASVRYDVWRTFLKDGYSNEIADDYWSRASDLVSTYVENEVIGKDRFVTAKTVFEFAYSTLFHEIGLAVDPKEAAQVLARFHPCSTPYDDAKLFLERVGERYPICLSSDADDDMLDQLTELCHFDEVITSESVASYKGASGKRFFSEVAARCRVQPADIIHIGDSHSDIVGANSSGIASCWLNRKRRAWQYDVRPDFEVNSLIEAALLLNVEIGAQADGET